MPISAILFGGRRSSVAPLIANRSIGSTELPWVSGGSETTAAASGEVGRFRHDPFAMLPFCGYNMADYFHHWLNIADKGDPARLPRIYYVNWFLKGKGGEWLWPGFGENCRVLKWIFERCEGTAGAVATPLGNVPSLKDFDVSGLNLSPAVLEQLFRIDKEAGLRDASELKQYLQQFGDRLPEAIRTELENLQQRLHKL